MTSMSSGADLFVVCKQCGSEVSPYVTECPYCGNRLRRRAPKLPRVGEGSIQAPRRQGLARLLNRPRPARAGAERRQATRARESRLRSFGIGRHTRPYATIALVGGSCVMYVLNRAEPELFLRMPILVAIACTGLFGWLVEQRHGPGAVLAIFLGAGVIGGLVAVAVYPLPLASGANAGALALLAAWAVPDLRAARAGDDYEGDLLGAGVLAAVLLAMPFASGGASWLAGVVGGLVGLVLGQAFSGLAADRPGGELG